MDLEFSLDAGIARLRLNRPASLNALTREMADELGDRCRAIARDEAVRAVLFTAAGRGFCSGADIAGTGAKDRSVGGVRRSYPIYQEAIRMLRRIPQPVVCAVRGPCVGVGWSLALASDWLIVSDTAKFSMIFAARGRLADGGAVRLLRTQIGDFRAKEILFTGRFVMGEEAMRLGLATELATDAALDARSETVARELADGPSVVLGLAKQLVNQDDGPFESYLDRETLAIPLAAQIEDQDEGTLAWREKRKPRFKGR